MEHPSNAPGDFDVEHGCCICCDVPLTLAPDLFSYDETTHCFVRKQPASLEETDRMIEVTANQELGCIRYRGRDPAILGRVEAQFCDETQEGADFLRRETWSTPRKPRWWQLWRQG